jgi:hypothetical protein
MADPGPAIADEELGCVCVRNMVQELMDSPDTVDEPPFICSFQQCLGGTIKEWVMPIQEASFQRTINIPRDSTTNISVT